MATTKVTKEDLQNEVKSLQEQVDSLRDELTTRSLQLGDVENQLEIADRQTGELVNELIDRVVDRADLENAVTVIEGLANQLAWTVSSVQSIALYHPPRLPQHVLTVTDSIIAESEDFWRDFNAGSYTTEAILGENREEVALDLTDIADLNTLSDILASVVPATEQEVPDDQPDSTEPFIGGAGYVNACEVCGDPEFNCGG